MGDLDGVEGREVLKAEVSRHGVEWNRERKRRLGGVGELEVFGGKFGAENFTMCFLEYL